MVLLEAALLERFPRFSLYNSPYAAHDRGCAVDLYPDAGPDAPSPVAGRVVETRTVRAPPKPYAPEHDHLVVVDVDLDRSPVRPTAGDGTDALLARVLHVDPAVEPGDRVAVGDPLGTLVRAGFFAPWVATHLHLGFRPPDADPVRAAGSLRVSLGVDVEPVPWDGTGTVVEAADTYAVLDAPAHPAPGERFAGIAGLVGLAGGDGPGPVVLDGGLPHYDAGGVLGDGGVPGDGAGEVAVLGTPVGAPDGRDVAWDDVAVLANGEPVTGLSLFCGRDDLYAKLVCPGVEFEEGEAVEVAVERGGGR